MSERLGDWMQTYTGKQFWPLNPRAEELDMLDIAHALSLQCRFAGACKQFYSVAEHCLLLSYAAPPELAYAALMHDAAEAYLVDLVRPIKSAIHTYRAIERRIMALIATRYKITGLDDPRLASMDERILNDERLQNMAAPPEPWAIDPQPLHVQLRFLAPPVAEATFLLRFSQLSPLIGPSSPPWAELPPDCIFAAQAELYFMHNHFLWERA